MKRWIAAALAASGLVALMAGCGVTGAASTGFRMFQNSERVDSHLKIMLDGQAATQDQFKKTVSGYSQFTISEPVGTSPTLRFEIIEPERFGRITMVTASIYQKFEADYSHQAEFTVYTKNNDPQAQMKPNTDYNLAGPTGQSVMDLYGKDAPGGVQLKPGMKYMLTLTVKADKSETAQIYFTTK
ncbi:MAG: hypothetical protein HZB38_19275 [Planctomycetes bacterium]|nr:hypothetical protein [Planctomycetota bacterium]